MLWTRASTHRKELRGIQPGVDKDSTLRLLSSSRLPEYDRGILRSILACAVYTQRALYLGRQVDHPICPFCWRQGKNLEHLFWHCPLWSRLRDAFLTPAQQHNAMTLPPCTLRTGIFVLTPIQSAAIVARHQQGDSDHRPLPPHPCDFHQAIHHMMIEIVKARKTADIATPPEDFDSSVFQRPQKTSTDDLHSNQAPQAPPAEQHVHRRRGSIPTAPGPTHDEHGLLLSTSKRPGGSKHQYVQKVQATGVYRAVISYKGKRQNFGPFQTEILTAERVKRFFEEADAGNAPLSRGEKRTAKFHQSVNDQLAILNTNAYEQGRHRIPDIDCARCDWCKKVVNQYYVIKFASQFCPEISNKVDKKGSLSRGAKLSETRTAKLQQEVDEHNKNAAFRGQHLVRDAGHPTCEFCQQRLHGII